ncbi:trichohyalin [Dunckerocampus dactyliophorus]|uniref:trichohyalin n=1 Tax=Dunckerocampus dactyliophorus TaxID=161453 RepID=UPI0024059795|nr:trichohyalin [Dunckerocampus dactyliophorus]
MSFLDQPWCPTSVQVTVLQARGLRAKGKGGTNDAYALMQVGKDKYQTSVVEKSVAPVWKEEAAFELSQHGAGGERATLHVHVLHRALVGPDKLLGQAVINLPQLSEDKTRNKTEWFKLLDKTGKVDKDRGEVLVDIQFLRNNMTASMFDLSAAGKPRSRLGKLKDKVRGKKKESDQAAAPSFTQVLTDSEEEEDGGQSAAGKEEKKKKHKLKSLFSHKSNLQRNMSQSMSVLPAKNSSPSGSMSSGLNVDALEGKKKFKFMKHKRSGSSDCKDQFSQKHSSFDKSNLCINGSHVYCEEPPPRTTRIGSNFSLASSGHGSMEDVPESSPPPAIRQYTTWEEEEEDLEDGNSKEEMERGKMIDRFEEEQRMRHEKEEEEDREQLDEEEESRLRKEDEERMRREDEQERLAENRRLEEEERRRNEEKARMEEQERMRRQELERLAEEKRRLAEEEKRNEENVRKNEEKAREDEEERRREEELERRAEEKKRMEEEERRRNEEKAREEEQERMKRQEELERVAEEKRRLEEEEKRNETIAKMDEVKAREDEERRQALEKLAEEKKRMEEEERRRDEEKARKEEQERMRRQEELERVAEEVRRLQEEERKRNEEKLKEEERMMNEEKARKEEQERMKRQEAEEQERLAEEKRRQEEDEMRRNEEKARKEEEEKMREEELERLAEEQRRVEEEERKRNEEKARKEEDERIKRREKELRRLSEEMRRQEEEERMKREEEQVRKEEERMRNEEKVRKEEQEGMRRQEEELERLAEEKRRLEEEEKERKKEEEERMRRQEELERLAFEEKQILEEAEKHRREEEERTRMEEERLKEEKMKQDEAEKIRKQEEQLAEEKKRLEEEERRIEKARQDEQETMRRQAEQLEEERRKEEEERRKKEEDERLADDEKRKKMEEASRREEDERVRKEENERKRMEQQEQRRTEEEERNGKEQERKLEEEEHKRKDKDMGTRRQEEQKMEMMEDRRRRETAESLTHVHSTNPFDEDVSNNDDIIPILSSGSKCSTLDTDTAILESYQVGSKTISVDEKKRPAPQPPCRTQGETPNQGEQDGPKRQLAPIAKQNKDKEVKTASVTPQSRSLTDAQDSISGTSSAAKHTKRPAPSIPNPEPRTVPVSLNPFEDDDCDDAASPHDYSSVSWPPPMSQTSNQASETKVKSFKSRAPAPPAKTLTAIQSTPNNKQTPKHAHTAPENDRALSHQESLPKECGPKQPAGNDASGKKEVPPAALRRLHPVKPLTTQEQHPVSATEGETDKSTRLVGKVQEKTKVKESGAKGPYSMLTKDELISLVVKQETQLQDKDKKIAELEQYIDNLLVRVMEEKPSILMSLKKVV